MLKETHPQLKNPKNQKNKMNLSKKNEINDANFRLILKMIEKIQVINAKKFFSEKV